VDSMYEGKGILRRIIPKGRSRPDGMDDIYIAFSVRSILL